MTSSHPPLRLPPLLVGGTNVNFEVLHVYLFSGCSRIIGLWARLRHGPGERQIVKMKRVTRDLSMAGWGVKAYHNLKRKAACDHETN
jgi:hypothetical protein